MRRTSVKRSLLIWCSVGLGTGFPKSAPCGTSMWRLSPAIHGLRNFWKACPQPHRSNFCWSLVSIAFSFSFLSVWVRERPWLINFIFPCFSVSSVAKKSPPPHIMHPSLNPQRPQLLVMPPSEIQYARFVMGHQRQATVLVSVVGQRRGQHNNGIPVRSRRRVEQNADRVGAGGSRVFGDAVGDVGFGGEVPQQVVEFFGVVFGVAEDAHAVALLPSFVHQFGGVEVAGGGGVLGEDVEPVALVLFVQIGR